MITARYAQTLRSSSGSWLYLVTARGPLEEDWKWYLARVDEAAQRAKVQALRTAVLKGRARDLLVVDLLPHVDDFVESAVLGRKWKALDALLGAMGPSVRQRALDEALRSAGRHPSELAVLLKLGANPNVQKGDVALLFSAQPASVDALLAHGADVLSRDLLGQTLLHVTRDLEMVRILLRRGAPVNALNQAGETPLAHALRFVTKETLPYVKLLVAAGADLSVKSGGLPLEEAIDFFVNERLANQDAARALANQIKPLLTPKQK